MHSTFSSVRESALSLVSDHYTILSPMKIAANDYGAPTVRARIFFFGFLPEHCEQLTESSFLPPTRVAKVRVRDALKGLTAEVDPAWQKVSDGWRISNCHGKGYYFSRLHGHIPNGVGDPIALHRLMTECKSSGTLGTVHSPSVFEEIRPASTWRAGSRVKSHKTASRSVLPNALEQAQGPISEVTKRSGPFIPQCQGSSLLVKLPGCRASQTGLHLLPQNGKAFARLEVASVRSSPNVCCALYLEP